MSFRVVLSNNIDNMVIILFVFRKYESIVRFHVDRSHCEYNRSHGYVTCKHYLLLGRLHRHKVMSVESVNLFECLS